MKTILMVVKDGGIVSVQGVPEGVELKVIDMDYESPIVHAYNADLTEEHRDITDEETAMWIDDLSDHFCNACGWDGMERELFITETLTPVCPNCHSIDIEDGCGVKINTQDA